MFTVRAVCLPDYSRLSFRNRTVIMAGVMYGSYENARMASASTMETPEESEAVKEFRLVENLLRDSYSLDGKTLLEQEDIVTEATAEQLEGIARPNLDGGIFLLKWANGQSLPTVPPSLQ